MIKKPFRIQHILVMLKSHSHIYHKMHLGAYWRFFSDQSSLV